MPVHTAIRKLEKLLLGRNWIQTKNAGKALGQALAQNTVLKELDVSGGGGRFKYMNRPCFAKHIIAGVKNMGALATITFGDKQAATMKADMTEADLSGKELGASGAIIVGAFLPKCK